MLLETTLLSSVLLFLTLLVLFIASYTDLKTKEVPDWISYSFIFTAFGIRTIFAIELGWNLIITGILGFIICLAMALVLYYSRQWGGADSKLLMGMGIVIGINYPLNQESFNLLLFVVALLFIGAIYSLLWIFFLAVKHRVVFTKTFFKNLRINQKIHLVTGMFSFAFLIITFFNQLVWPFVIFPLAIFYLFLLVTSVEEKCFIKEISPEKLTEGDWLVEDIIVDGKKVMVKKTLENKDVLKLKDLHQKNKLNLISIKEGIPFVPSFLFAYLLIIFGDKLILEIVNYLI